MRILDIVLSFAIIIFIIGIIIGIFGIYKEFEKQPTINQPQLEQIVIKKLDNTVKQDYTILCFSNDYKIDNIQTKYTIAVKYIVNNVLITELCYIDAETNQITASKFITEK